MSLTTDAFERIRDAIVAGGLELGEPLSETQIAKALGMSKAPVRAAFIELRDKGLVNIVPQSGTYVFSPSPEDVLTMSQFRALLEEEAVTQAHARRPAAMFERLDAAIEAMRKAVETQNWEAYRKGDSAFHMAFLDESGNRYLGRAYALTSSALEALRVRLQRGETKFRGRSFREHCEIAQYLRDGNLADAIALLHQHILIINEWLHSLPLETNRGTRKDKPEDRDYAEVFALLDRRS
jgi:DNA-binding GntR family transcriptional regulator